MYQAYSTMAVETQDVGSGFITEWLNALPGARTMCPDGYARRIAAVRHFVVVENHVIAIVDLAPTESELAAWRDSFLAPLPTGSAQMDPPTAPPAETQSPSARVSHLLAAQKRAIQRFARACEGGILPVSDDSQVGESTTEIDS